MLKSLSIRNVVLIDALDIDFSKGLTVLSGETGAGKSILLDSLGLLLGNRGETSLIRIGTDKLSVTGVFELEKTNKIYDIAKEYDLEIEEDIIIKRIITQEGKNKILFNDQPITLKLLKQISQHLIEIHGQHDNQGLLNQELHCQILDDYGNYQKELHQTKEAYHTYKTIEKELKQKQSILAKTKEDEENIKHWVKELEKASPEKGEETELKNKRNELMNAEKIIDKLNTAYSCLNGNISIIDQLTKARNAISRANEIVNGKYQDIEETLENSLYSLNDVLSQIENSSNDISLNTNEIDNIETRLFLLRDLAKKHQTDIDLLPEKLEELKTDLNNIQYGEEEINLLRQEVQALKDVYKDKAQKLTEQRINTAKLLDKNITKELPPLKMEKARFETSITHKTEDYWSEYGCDDVCLRFQQIQIHLLAL